MLHLGAGAVQALSCCLPRASQPFVLAPSELKSGRKSPYIPAATLPWQRRYFCHFPTPCGISTSTQAQEQPESQQSPCTLVSHASETVTGLGKARTWLPWQHIRPLTWSPLAWRPREHRRSRRCPTQPHIQTAGLLFHWVSAHFAEHGSGDHTLI